VGGLNSRLSHVDALSLALSFQSLEWLEVIECDLNITSWKICSRVQSRNGNTFSSFTWGSPVIWMDESKVPFDVIGLLTYKTTP